MRKAICILLAMIPLLLAGQERLTVVEWNVENLFDTTHDSLKNDYDFLPNGRYRWSSGRYWRKLNRMGQALISCGEDSTGWSLPDIVGLCEVENDTVMRDLTRRSLLRKARYEYVMTSSPDERGIDVALMYAPFSFRLIQSYALRVLPLKGMKPTRDILYASGELISGDTLHVFVVHAPSRSAGERATRSHRLCAMERLCASIDSIRARSEGANVLVMGDFNDYADDASLRKLYAHGMENVSRCAAGKHGARGTYRWQGEWGSLDQMVVSGSLAAKVASCRINDAPFLLEEDTKYGGVKPRRNFLGPRYQNGFSDHLPLVLTLRLAISGQKVADKAP
ncbi:MAG: endonuclease [Prevotella sp.]|nr:endonuclease [Prevotella sp.]